MHTSTSLAGPMKTSTMHVHSSCQISGRTACAVRHYLPFQNCYTTMHYCCVRHRLPRLICYTVTHYCCRRLRLPSLICYTAMHYCCRRLRLPRLICYTAMHYCCRRSRPNAPLCYTAIRNNPHYRRIISRKNRSAPRTRYQASAHALHGSLLITSPRW